MNLKKELKKRKLTYREMSAMSGVSLVQIWRYCSKNVEPRNNVAIRLELALKEFDKNEKNRIH